jgi:hypothetical protein
MQGILETFRLLMIVGLVMRFSCWSFEDCEIRLKAMLKYHYVKSVGNKEGFILFLGYLICEIF